MSGKRIHRRFATSLPASPHLVFPLLCPVREYDWLPGWQCELVYSKSGYAELGCVFRTDFGSPAGKEIWVVCAYEKDRRISFVKTGKHCTTLYHVILTPQRTGSSISWEQEITSLDEQGTLLMAELSETVYLEKMTVLNRLLSKYLLHGTGKTNHEPDDR